MSPINASSCVSLRSSKPRWRGGGGGGGGLGGRLSAGAASGASFSLPLGFVTEPFTTGGPLGGLGLAGEAALADLGFAGEAALADEPLALALALALPPPLPLPPLPLPLLLLLLPLPPSLLEVLAAAGASSARRFSEPSLVEAVSQPCACACPSSATRARVAPPGCSRVSSTVTRVPAGSSLTLSELSSSPTRTSAGLADAISCVGGLADSAGAGASGGSGGGTGGITGAGCSPPGPLLLLLPLPLLFPSLPLPLAADAAGLGDAGALGGLGDAADLGGAVGLGGALAGASRPPVGRTSSAKDTRLVLGSFSGGAGFDFAGEGAPLPDGFDLVGVPGRTVTVAVFAIERAARDRNQIERPALAVLGQNFVLILYHDVSRRPILM